MNIIVSTEGDWNKTEKELKNLSNSSNKIISILNDAGTKGISLLADNTPKLTGKTASSWTYEITQKQSGYELSFSNNNVIDNCNIAIMIEYGHGTRFGGYVEGIDYINPTIKPLFDELTQSIWKEVEKL